jgi:hypothetical protein
MKFKFFNTGYSNMKKERHGALENQHMNKPPFAHFPEKPKKTLLRLLKEYSGNG